jgi:hypothetical protein
MQADLEMNGVDEPVGLTIVGEADGLGDIGAHAADLGRLRADWKRE